MLLMLQGFDTGVIKFGLITCTKKEDGSEGSDKDLQLGRTAEGGTVVL